MGAEHAEIHLTCPLHLPTMLDEVHAALFAPACHASNYLFLPSTMALLQTFRTLAAQETPAQRRRRMIPGLCYGLTIAGVYTLFGATINQLSYPDLPIGVDWHSLILTGALTAVWLGLGGLLTNWFTYGEESLTYSVPLMIIGLLIVGLALTDGGLLEKMSTSALLLLILPGYSILMTLILRALGARHADLLEQSVSVRRRGVAWLIVIAVLLGALPGFSLLRWSDLVVVAAQGMQTRLQNATNAPDNLGQIFPVENLPGLEQHLGSPYTLRARPATESVVAYDVTVDFADGYQMTCVLLVFSNQPPPFLRACAEGEQVALPEQ